MTDQLQPNDRLLKIMEARELREAKKFEIDEAKRRAEEDNYAVRVLRQEQNDHEMWNAVMLWQSKCDHRKGTTGKKKWKHIDYMVDRHTLQNGTTRIKCQKCRFKAFPGDTAEKCSYTLENFMKGIKVVNPTRLSYAEWYKLTLDENTTNTETRSEMVTQGPVPVTA